MGRMDSVIGYVSSFSFGYHNAFGSWGVKLERGRYNHRHGNERACIMDIFGRRPTGLCI